MDHLTLLLDSGRLNEAFEYIDNFLTASPDATAVAPLRSELERLRESYGFMSRYMLDGLPDPGRSEQYEDVAEGLRSIGERVQRMTRMADHPSLYYNVARMHRHTSQSVELAELMATFRETSSRLAMAPLTEDAAKATERLTDKSELTLRRLFEVIWTSHPFTSADAELMAGALTDVSLPRHAKLQWVSALMMGLLEFFDEKRMMLLIDLYENPDREMSVRALAALTVALWRHRKRRLPRRLRHRLKLMADAPFWPTDVATVTLQFIRARDTERVARKFTGEIMPDLQRLRPEIEKLRTSSPVSPDELLEDNPEWAELLEKSKIGDRLKEMQEMQEEGADVMMPAFAQFKSFPFFHDIDNWFLPFHAGHSLFRALPPEMTGLVETLTASPMFCDSDRFSVLLSISMVPAAQREMIVNQMKLQSEHIDMVRASGSLTRDKRDEEVATGYVRDLYRFFKLYRRKGEFADPFADGINPVEITWYKDIFEADPELMMTIAEFYFKRRYMSDALKVFEKLADITGPDATLYQKMGYCYEAQGQTDDAIRLYEQSELLDASSRWTMRRLAAAYRATGNWEGALRYYTLLAEQRPEDPALALNMGLCLVKLRRFDEALPHLFKAEYLGNENIKSLRAIAWCTLLDGDLDRASRYIGKLFDSVDQPTANDHLNAGHISLLGGKFREAVDHYARSIAAREFDIDSFLADFDADSLSVGPLAETPVTDLMIVRDAAIALSSTLGKSL